MPIPKPQITDDIELDGIHYLLSKQQGKWVIKHDGNWKMLNEGYDFAYLGPEGSGGKSKWKLTRKVGTPKLKFEETDIDKTLNLYEIHATLNKHTDVFSVRARDENHARLLALGELSRRLKMPIPLLRHKLLPDAFTITLKSN
jgi:hypothetical protein